MDVVFSWVCRRARGLKARRHTQGNHPKRKGRCALTPPTGAHATHTQHTTHQVVVRRKGGKVVLRKARIIRRKQALQAERGDGRDVRKHVQGKAVHAAHALAQAAVERAQRGGERGGLEHAHDERRRDERLVRALVVVVFGGGACVCV